MRCPSLTGGSAHRILLVLTLLLAPLSAWAAKPAPLPDDSVYHLQATMTDQSGKRHAWAQLRGKPRVVSMFYTSCAYMCPLIVDAGLNIDKALTPAQRARIGIVLVSMDPARDTPAAMLSVASKRKLDPKRWMLLRPAPEDVRNVAGVLGIRYRLLADGEFNHTSELVLLDADGRILARTDKIGSAQDPAFLAAVRKAAGKP